MKNSIKPYLNSLDDPTLNPQILVFNQAFPQNATTEQIRENIVSFNIFYNDLNYDFVNDVAQYNYFILLANLAGILGGSFLGMSLLSVFEFFERILYAFWTVTLHICKKLKCN
jgi:hypothetical protein